MGRSERTAGGTVAEFEAWYAANPEEGAPDASEAAAALSDLFDRAARAGADLHDPEPELLRWLTRDLARDDDLPDGGYDRAITALPRYLLFLRAHRLWRRSERTVQDCWRILDWATAVPLGIETFGATIDEVISSRLRMEPPWGAVEEAMAVPAFLRPLRSGLRALLDAPELTRAAFGAAAGLGSPLACDLWVEALHDADLVLVDPDEGTLRVRRHVREGGLPPVDSDLVDQVVMGLVRAVLDHGFARDSDEGRTYFPRGIAAMTALLAATDDSFFLLEPGVEDDEEQTTRDAVETMVTKLSTDTGEADPTEVARLCEEVLTTLQVLVDAGLLRPHVLPVTGGTYLMAPEALWFRVARTVGDYLGMVGGPDETVVVTPVDLPLLVDPGAGLELRIELEQASGAEPVWRSVRVPADARLPHLEQVVQRSLGWRGLHRAVFCEADGRRRFAEAGWLQAFSRPEDVAVTASDDVRLGSVLPAPGATLRYVYGVQRPAGVRIAVTGVDPSPTTPFEVLDGAGRSPGEPSLTALALALAERLPAGIVLPGALQVAWEYMESQGWRDWSEDEDELLSPGPGAGRSCVTFHTGLRLPDGVHDDAAARLLPIGVVPGGAMLCLWLDDEGDTRFTVVDPVGEAYVVADDGTDLLRVLAIGYDRLSSSVLGRPPGDPASIAEVAELRRFLTEGFGVAVPDAWPAPRADAFTRWWTAQWS